MAASEAIGDKETWRSDQYSNNRVCTKFSANISLKHTLPCFIASSTDKFNFSTIG